MANTRFGFKCQECGKGTVEDTFEVYPTRIHGEEVLIEDAMIGVCNVCGAEHFDAAETIRWKQEYEKKHAKAR